MDQKKLEKMISLFNNKPARWFENKKAIALLELVNGYGEIIAEQETVTILSKNKPQGRLIVRSESGVKMEVFYLNLEIIK